MRTTKGKILGLAGLFLLLCLCAVLATFNVNSQKIALADVTNAEDNFVVTENIEHVAATYEFVPINDYECSVRISNKTEATKAVIPSSALVDGKSYKVTEIAANGFTSCTKLTRVSLPFTIKKIGNSAFSNCQELSRISLANVAEIGNSAFYRCTKLEELVIPESVSKIGTYILRNNNTQVRVRANFAGAEWATNWNSNNTNQTVEYGRLCFE